MTYSAEVLIDSPLLYWRFGDSSGTTATDASGNARSGTYTNGPTLGMASLLASDLVNTSVSFDGIDDYVTYPDTTDLTDFTVECWIKTPSTPTSFLIHRWGITSSDEIFCLKAQSDGGVSFQITNAATFGIIVATGPYGLFDDAPHHVVATYGSGDLNLYIDGVVAAVPASIAGPLNTSDRPFQVGAMFDGSISGPFSGVIDEVAYYAGALSADRVLAHYNAGVADPPSPPTPEAPDPGWTVGLDGIGMCGGGDCTDDLNVVACLTSIDGVGVPPLRITDQTYPQRDGVEHFGDYYDARILTFTATIGDDDCHVSTTLTPGDAAALLTHAWRRRCEDVELVLWTGRDVTDFPELITNGEFDYNVTGWGAANATLAHETGFTHNAPGSLAATVAADGPFQVFPVDSDDNPLLIHVLPGFQFTLAAWQNEATGGTSGLHSQILVQWFDAAGDSVGDISYGPVTPVDLAGWGQVGGGDLIVVAPDSAVSALPTFQLTDSATAGDVFYLDSFTFRRSGNETVGPYGVIGRPRVATLDWVASEHDIADATLRFDAVDHLLYILDEDGTPGSGTECSTLSAVPEGPIASAFGGSDVDHGWPLDFTHIIPCSTCLPTDPTKTAVDTRGSGWNAFISGGAMNTTGAPEIVPPLLYTLSLSAVKGASHFQASKASALSYTNGMIGFWLETPTDLTAPSGAWMTVGANVIGLDSFGNVPAASITWQGTTAAMNSDVQDYFGFTSAKRGEPVFIMITWKSTELKIYGMDEASSTPFLLQTLVTGAGLPNLNTSGFTISALGTLSNVVESTDKITSSTIANATIASIHDDVFAADPSAMVLADVGSECVPFTADFSIDAGGAWGAVYILREDGSFVGFADAVTITDNPAHLDTSDGSATLFYGTADGSNVITGDPFLQISPGETIHIFGGDGDSTTVTICWRPAVLSA